MGEYEVIEDFWAVDNRGRDSCFLKGDIVRGYLHPANPFVTGEEDKVRVKYINGRFYGRNGADYCFIPRRCLIKRKNAFQS